MKYIFLSVNENLSCGLLKSQFLEPIKHNFKYKYEIISINRPLYRGKVEGVDSLNVLIPQSVVAYNFFCVIYSVWAIFCALLLKAKCGLKNDTKLVARGYLSGLIAYYVKRFFGLDYIFDPRSLYPLECITANRMKKHSWSYRYWIKLESKIVRFAERTVCVSSGMAKHYSCRYDVDNTIIIPCFRTEHGGFEKSYSLTSLKEKLNLDQKKKTVLYFGSLNSGWNNLELYTKLISCNFSGDVQFLIISQDRDKILASKLGSLKNVYVNSIDTLPEGITMEDIFHCADYGMIFMAESHDWFTRLSVKFAEYTYFGLPVITNRWVGEASRLINDYGIFPSKVVETEEIELVAPTLEQRIKISNWASEYFSPNNINKYVSN
ncbi:hypothetical protein [Vibrio sp. SCSIO 43136]|uniref:hypothetical protein n=1 Tax=Vibrio sp. SCSIO 43136 TaxID=2819101 RepID=UPI0020759721|nr:hypothetical protein [Vibrio sp. SCSIO 43136]USD65110.1 hypothetical protein J4N39_13845 [Vibrio sp. SCSIO 43136]